MVFLFKGNDLFFFDEEGLVMVVGFGLGFGGVEGVVEECCVKVFSLFFSVEVFMLDKKLFKEVFLLLVESVFVGVILWLLLLLGYGVWEVYSFGFLVKFFEIVLVKSENLEDGVVWM